MRRTPVLVLCVLAAGLQCFGAAAAPVGADDVEIETSHLKVVLPADQVATLTLTRSTTGANER